MNILFGALVCGILLFRTMETNASECPSANGTFAVQGSCDAYIECKNGKSEEKVCPDGLLFNPYSRGYPCSYPKDVDCAAGLSRHAKPTQECPHQFGYFRIGDASNCGQYMNCVDGVAHHFSCPDGLAWSEEEYRCDWPDQVPECDAESYLGFKCPQPQAKLTLHGEQQEEYQFYASDYDCQKYFLCVEGLPRLISCADDKAFNPDTHLCDDIEHVATCSAEVQTKALEIKNARLAAAQAKPRLVPKLRS